MACEFVVAGRVSDTVRAAFPEFDVVDGPAGGTAIYGPVRDRAAIGGVLARLGQDGGDRGRDAQAAGLIGGRA